MRRLPVWALSLFTAFTACASAHAPATPSASAAATSPAASTITTLVFVATTDIHGHIESEPVELSIGSGHASARRGGLPLLGGYLAILRRQHPGHVVLVDGGDMLQGTMVSNFGDGRAVVEAMNALGYAGAAVGNHEFDFGAGNSKEARAAAGGDPLAVLKQRSAEAHYRWLTSNIVDEHGDPAGAPAVRAFTIVEVGGVKVGLVGGTSEDTPRTTRSSNLTALRVEPLAETIPRAAAAARAAGATIVVALLHEGGECARFDAPDDLSSCKADSALFKLARALPPGTVDAIFGGHTHQGVAHRVAGIPLVQAYSAGRMFGRLDLDVDTRTGKVVGTPRIHAPEEICEMVANENASCDPKRARGTELVQARYEGEPVVADAAVAASFADDVARAAAERATPVGVTLVAPIAARYRDPSELGDLVADALRAGGGAEIGLANGGGLRSDLPAGVLLRGALFEAQPFDNRLAVFKLRGRTFAHLLETNLAGSHGILSVSNVTARAECKGGRLIVEDVRVGGHPLAADRLYSVATIDFLAQGGDDFATLKDSLEGLRLDESAPLARDLVAAELVRHGPRIAPDVSPWGGSTKPRLRLPGPRPITCNTTG